jgi:hypothetical protein
MRRRAAPGELRREVLEVPGGGSLREKRQQPRGHHGHTGTRLLENDSTLRAATWPPPTTTARRALSLRDTGRYSMVMRRLCRDDSRVTARFWQRRQVRTLSLLGANYSSTVPHSSRDFHSLSLGGRCGATLMLCRSRHRQRLLGRPRSWLVARCSWMGGRPCGLRAVFGSHRDAYGIQIPLGPLSSGEAAARDDGALSYTKSLHSTV